MNERRPPFLPKLPVKTELFGSEGILSQMRGRVEIVRAYPQGCAEDDPIEDRWTGVDEEMTTLRRLDNAMKIAGIHLLDREQQPFAQKGAGSARVAIATSHLVPLPDEQLSQQ